MVTQIFRQNRARFPHEELNKFRGEWVAFSADGNGIVAHAKTIEELETQLEATGENGHDVVLERVAGPEDDCFLGAGEWM